MLAALDPSKSVSNISGKSFISLESLISTPKLNRLRSNIKERQKIQKKYHKEYTQLLKSQNNYLSADNRAQRLENVLQRQQRHTIISTFHEYEEESQDIVDALLLDQRCRTGMKIMKLWEAIKATDINEIPPHEIVDFLQDFVDQTGTEFSITDEYLERLRLCVGRAVYPVIFPFLWDFQHEENEQSDARFEAQQRILRSVAPAKLDPVLAPFSHDLTMFEEGISILEDLAFQIVRVTRCFLVFVTNECVFRYLLIC